MASWASAALRRRPGAGVSALSVPAMVFLCCFSHVPARSSRSSRPRVAGGIPDRSVQLPIRSLGWVGHVGGSRWVWTHPPL